MGYINFWYTLMVFISWVKIWSTIKKNTEALLGGSKKVGLEVKVEETKPCSCLFTRMRDKITV
jgi:hypothetical protein